MDQFQKTDESLSVKAAGAFFAVLVETSHRRDAAFRQDLGKNFEVLYELLSRELTCQELEQVHSLYSHFCEYLHCFEWSKPPSRGTTDHPMP